MHRIYSTIWTWRPQITRALPYWYTVGSSLWRISKVLFYLTENINQRRGVSQSCDWTWGWSILGRDLKPNLQYQKLLTVQEHSQGFTSTGRIKNTIYCNRWYKSNEKTIRCKRTRKFNQITRKIWTWSLRTKNVRLNNSTVVDPLGYHRSKVLFNLKDDINKRILFKKLEEMSHHVLKRIRT